MKKIIMILLMLVMCLMILSGCNSESPSSGNKPDSLDDMPSPYETSGWW